MRERINKITEGTFNYEIPKITFSREKIEFYSLKNKLYRGSFEIICPQNCLAEGKVYSSSYRMDCLTKKFKGERCEIHFEFNSEGLDYETDFSGDFNIISDAGEYCLPFVCHNVLVKKKEKEVGTIKEFIGIAKKDFDKGYNYFFSPEFFRLMKTADEKEQMLYYGFTKGKSSKQDMEEFLIACGYKDKIRLHIQNDFHYFENISESVKETICITKDNWGYFQIDIIADGDFILPDEESITSNDFIGNTYNLEYCIDYDKLHEGINYGKITINSIYQSCEYIIKAHKRKEFDQKRADRLEIKHHRIELAKLYKKYKLNNLALSIWAKESMLHLNRILSIEPDSRWCGLMKAQFLILTKQKQEADWLLDKFKANSDSEDKELWSYYLYICTLSDGDKTFVSKIKEEVRQLQKDMPESEWIQWFLLYTDENYNKNAVKKFIAIRKYIKRGCTSPIMYIEAYKTINKDPFVLSRIEKEEICIFYKMYKDQYIQKETARQFMNLLSTYKGFNKRLYEIAVYCCNKYGIEDDIPEFIRLMCKYLIRSDKKGIEYKRWYEKGLELDLKITGIYEYYISCIDEKQHNIIPKIVYMYFKYNSSLDNRKKAYLYASLINVKNEYQDIYNDCQMSIRMFMEDQLSKHVISDSMAVIYNQFLSSYMITEDIVDDVLAVSSYCKIECKEKYISKVSIIYQKLNREDNASLIKGEAYIKVRSEDYCVIFYDLKGCRISDRIDYKLIKLIDYDEYIKKCLNLKPDNSMLLLRCLENTKKYNISVNEQMLCLHKCIEAEEIKEYFKKFAKSKIIDYYYQRPSEHGELNEYLLSIPVDGVTQADRDKIIEILLKRRRYKQAYNIIEKYGYENVDIVELLKMCRNFIESNNGEYNRFLNSLCWYIFKNGKYDEIILTYLGENYSGTLEELRAIYNASNIFYINTHDFKQKMIMQSIYTGVYISDIEEIFDEYYKEGASKDILVSYLSYYSYLYFVKNQVILDKLFMYIRKRNLSGEYVNKICRLAYLKYLSEKQNYDNTEKNIISEYIEGFISQNLYFKFYNKLGFNIISRYGLNNRKIIEYYTNPNSKVVIHYSYDKDGAEFIKEEMHNIYEGIFSKSVTLFEKEIFQYYITEEIDGKTQIVESDLLRGNEMLRNDFDSSYDILNNIIISKNADDITNMVELINKWEHLKYITENIFTIL